MKKGLLVVVLSLFLLTSIVSAQTTCLSPEDVILKLSGNTNAHGEVHNGPNYNHEICLSDIFDTTGFTIPSNPQVCGGTGTDLVLKLSGTTNAHAEGPAGTTYAEDVCHTELTACVERDASIGCDYAGGESLVVKLSTPTNAHLEDRNGLIYPTLICCQSVSSLTPIIPGGSCDDGTYDSATEICDGSDTTTTGCESTPLTPVCNPTCTACVAAGGPGPGSIDSVWWEDSTGAVITTSYVNDTVFLVAQTTGLTGNLEFDLDEIDDVINDDIFDITIPIVSNPIKVPLTLDDATVALGGFGGIAPLDVDPTWEYVFEAKQGALFLASPQLDVENFENPNPPELIANITGTLVHQGVYYVGADIEFNHSSTGGTITSFLWTVVDQTGTQIVTGFEDLESFVMNFLNPGQYTITLRIESSDGQVDEDQLSILVLASPGIFGYINMPQHQDFVQQVPGPAYEVSFSATDSYVVDSQLVVPAGIDVTCTGSVTCVAGDCPAQTETAPPTCLPGALGGVVAGDGTIPIGGITPMSYNLINFDWTFEDGHGSLSGLGETEGTKHYAFMEGGSETYNDKRIDLTLTYNDGATDYTTSVSREYTLGQCFNGGRIFVDLSQAGNPELDTDEANNGCMGLDGVDGTMDDCCQAGRACVEDSSNPGSGNYRCEVTATSTMGCAAILDPTDCNTAPDSIVTTDPLYHDSTPPGPCTDEDIDCSCAWDASETPSCGLVKKVDAAVTLTPGETCTGYQCTYHSQPAVCNNGFMQVSASATFTPAQGVCDTGETAISVGCEDVTRTVPCGQFNIELGFFESKQMLIAIGSIFLIYAVYYLLNREHKK